MLKRQWDLMHGLLRRSRRQSRATPSSPRGKRFFAITTPKPRNGAGSRCRGASGRPESGTASAAWAVQSLSSLDKIGPFAACAARNRNLWHREAANKISQRPSAAKRGPLRRRKPRTRRHVEATQHRQHILNIRQALDAVPAQSESRNRNARLHRLKRAGIRRRETKVQMRALAQQGAHGKLS